MSAREKILDAAASVIRQQGLARATTKEIARAAGYSEALLYKHFEDKQAIFVGVLQERVGGLADPQDLAGSGDVHANLARITADLMAFYVQTFPMAASIFGSPQLLGAWRDGLASRGDGPRAPRLLVQRYLELEIGLSRLHADTDAASVATLLCGAAFQTAFLACFDGLAEIPERKRTAERLVEALRLRVG